MITAEVILDSISPTGHRLTTLKLKYPKFIHGEVMTHRVFSRNASSSRAVPTSKYLEEVRSDDLRAAPIYWGRRQAGMGASEELTGSDLEYAKQAWAYAAEDAADRAEWALEHGGAKEWVNRILEPYLHINVIVTATEWANFFGLRLDKAAQPEMRALAVAAYRAMRVSMATQLEPGEWHLPFVDYREFMSTRRDLFPPNGLDRWVDRHMQCAIRVSVARCARISYMSFETGKLSTVEEDLALYDRLLTNRHLSPFEHIATPDEWIIPPPGWDNKHWGRPDEHGNFVGWRQLRQTIPGQAVAPLSEGFEL